MLFCHQIKDLLSLLGKAQIKLASKVNRLTLVSVFYHPFIYTQLIISVGMSLEQEFYATTKRFLGLCLTVVSGGSLRSVIHNKHLEFPGFIFDE